jgi:hypothetical protein
MNRNNANDRGATGCFGPLLYIRGLEWTCHDHATLRKIVARRLLWFAVIPM